MNQQQENWIRRDWPRDTIEKPYEPYAYGVSIAVREGQQLDINLKQYIAQGPLQVVEKPYFLRLDGTHIKGTVPIGGATSYKIVIEDRGGSYE